MSQGWLASDFENSLASPKKLPVTDVGMPIFASAAEIVATASLSAAPCSRLKLMVCAGN